jgi:molybdopterin-synthase adenylyltransferase
MLLGCAFVALASLQVPGTTRLIINAEFRIVDALMNSRPQPITREDTDAERYSRQRLFAPIGEEGQKRLLASEVAIVGCGATGSAVASLVARAGVGTLRIIDRDYVEPSNLQRQTLFDESDAAESIPKALAAARKIAQFNSGIVVHPMVTDLVPTNAEQCLSGVNLILDGTDNFETRYLINDFAISRNVPWIYAAAVGSYALTMNILPGQTACLSCIFPQPPRGPVDTCDTAGILNTAISLIASIQATEAIKIIVQADHDVRRTLLSHDLWKNEQSEISASAPRADCIACQQKEFPHLSGEGRPRITLCGRNSVQIHERHRPVSFPEMTARLSPHGTVKHNEFVLKFWRDQYEMTLFTDGRAIIKGTTDPALARSLYARYIGS